MGRKKRESEGGGFFLVTDGFSLRWKFHEVSERMVNVSYSASVGS